MPSRVILNVFIYTHCRGNKYLVERLGNRRKDYDRISRLVWSLQKNPYMPSGSEAKLCINVPQVQSQDKQPCLIFLQLPVCVYAVHTGSEKFKFPPWMENILFNSRQPWLWGLSVNACKSRWCDILERKNKIKCADTFDWQCIMGPVVLFIRNLLSLETKYKLV